MAGPGTPESELSEHRVRQPRHVFPDREIPLAVSDHVSQRPRRDDHEAADHVGGMHHSVPAPVVHEAGGDEQRGAQRDQKVTMRLQVEQPQDARRSPG